MLTAKKSFNIPLFENGRHSNSSGMPAIKKTLWLLPKSFLPLPLAGLEPARCYPLDFEFFKPFRSIWNVLVLNGTYNLPKTA